MLGNVRKNHWRGYCHTPEAILYKNSRKNKTLTHKNSLTLTQSIVVKCNLLQEAAYNAKQHIMYPAAKFWQVPHTGAHKKPVQKSEYRDDHLILAQQRGYCILSWTHQPDRNVMCYSEGPGGTAWTEMSRFCLAPAASPLLSWCNSMCERSGHAETAG